MKELTLITNAEIEYRSHIGAFACTNPDSWFSALAEDENGKQYKVWFEITNPEATEAEDMCDWNDLSDYEEIQGNKAMKELTINLVAYKYGQYRFSDEIGWMEYDDESDLDESKISKVAKKFITDLNLRSTYKEGKEDHIQYDVIVTDSKDNIYAKVGLGEIYG